MPLTYDARGLIPAVLQDAATGEILMMAWMNEEALQLTLETREAHFWSRSRRTLWHKGATSGNVQRVTEIRVDCDADVLLLKVEPAGPACHTGERSCFYRRLWPRDLRVAMPIPEATVPEERDAMDDVLDELFDVILDRKANPTPGSYTAKLLDGGDEVLKKVGEEAMEVLLAGKGQSDQRLVEESADLLYHLLVLLASRDLTLDDVRRELAKRRR